MFRKPIKIKSNSPIKGSERRAIKDFILKSFSKLSETDLDELWPKKKTLNCIKVITSSDEAILVYSLEKLPIFFSVRDVLFPTVYLLWKYPNLIPAFTIPSEVMTFINSGANLMLPGVLTHQSGANKYGNCRANEVAYINLSHSRAAIAVGTTLQSSGEMVRAGGRGGCVKVYHTLGDKLCSVEGPFADLKPPQLSHIVPPQISNDEDFPALNAPSKIQRRVTNECEVIENTDTLIDETQPEAVVIDNQMPSEPVVQSITPDEMNEYLMHAFMAAIKYSKNITLPVLTSNFYKLHMLPNSPDGVNLDLKKSTYKKLKPFLDEMSKLGLIEVKEVKKGVESITAINKEHPKFSEFYLEPAKRLKNKEEACDTPSLSVTESYIITTNVASIFKESNMNKGDTVSVPTIRRLVTEYVKKTDCVNADNPKMITPKEDLAKICRTTNSITWEELMEKVCASMKSCFKVKTGSEEVVNKGNLSPITMLVKMRTGNKKVTLIDNLELFAVNLLEFSKEVQHGIAASTSIVKSPLNKSNQLLVQGNQVVFIHKILTEKYNIPAKYIRGLENAPKKKR